MEDQKRILSPSEQKALSAKQKEEEKQSLSNKIIKLFDERLINGCYNFKYQFENGRIYFFNSNWFDNQTYHHLDLYDFKSLLDSIKESYREKGWIIKEEERKFNWFSRNILLNQNYYILYFKSY